MVFIYVVRCSDLNFFWSLTPDFHYTYDINLCSTLYQCFPLSIITGLKKFDQIVPAGTVKAWQRELSLKYSRAKAKNGFIVRSSIMRTSASIQVSNCI